jgi:hypothetical protein
MDDHKDVERYSDSQLFDILTHVDRQKYPERYNAVRDEFTKRHGQTVDGVPVDQYFALARLNRPFAERWAFKKKVLLAVALWAAIMLAVRGVMYLVSLF